MTKVHAIFEKGVFRPIEPVKISDGVQVELSFEEPATTTPQAPLVSALAEIAKLPLESPDDGFSGADHDRVLYGERSRQ
jgi:predicted DNA-binding antitoxin AbrB/MazE fold protein